MESKRFYTRFSNFIVGITHWLEETTIPIAKEYSREDMCSRCGKNQKGKDSIYCIECKYERTMRGY